MLHNTLGMVLPNLEHGIQECYFMLYNTIPNIIASTICNITYHACPPALQPNNFHPAARACFLPALPSALPPVWLASFHKPTRQPSSLPWRLPCHPTAPYGSPSAGSRAGVARQHASTHDPHGHACLQQLGYVICNITFHSLPTSPLLVLPTSPLSVPACQCRLTDSPSQCPRKINLSKTSNREP